MLQIIIKLIDFFLDPRLIPSKRDQMHQKVFLLLTKSIFENIKCGIKWRQAGPLLFKYYISKLRGVGVLVCADSPDEWKGFKIMENMPT